MLRLVAVVLVALGVCRPLDIRGQDTTWTNLTGNGLWSTADNWNHGVPGAANRALLNLTTASYTVTNDVPATIDKLLVDNAAGKKTTLVVTDRLRVASASSGCWSFFNNSRLIVKPGGLFVVTNGLGYFNANSVANLGSALIENGGLMEWGNYQLDLWFVAITNRGTMKSLSTPATSSYLMMRAGSNTRLVLDGGLLLDPRNVLVGQLTITNSGALYNRYAANLSIKGLWIGGYAAAHGANQINTFTLASGTVTNRCALRIGDQGSGEGYEWWSYPTHTTWTNGNQTGILNINGGTFVQDPIGIHAAVPVGLGTGRIGIMNLNGGTFSTVSSVAMGGQYALTLAPGVQRYGEINMNSGSFTATHAAGTAALNVGSSVATGRVNLVGGTMTVDRFLATNGSFSVVNFSGGTLNTKATKVDNGSSFTVGNGVSAATLGLTGGAHGFTNGLTFAANATLAVGGVSAIGSAAIAGDVTLQENAALDVDISATTNDWATITGTLTLPASGALTVRALDDSLRPVIPILEATAVSDQGVDGWSPATVNGRNYKAVLNVNRLELRLLPLGTVIAIQ